MNRAVNIAVAGGSTADEKTALLAYEVGSKLAKRGWVLICGGLGGVMEAVSRGAVDNGGTTLGILPGYDHSDANKHIKIVIPTGLGHARNAILASSADGMIAVGGGNGTLSEIALALKMGKPVVALNCAHAVKGMAEARTAGEALDFLNSRIKDIA